MNRERIADELAAAIELRKKMKAANRIAHASKLSREQRILRLCRDCGMDLNQAERLMTPDACGRIGYTDFALMRNAEAIRKRRAALGPAG